MKHIIFSLICFISTLSFFSQSSPIKRENLKLTTIIVEKSPKSVELNTLDSVLKRKEKKNTFLKEETLVEPKKTKLK